MPTDKQYLSITHSFCTHLVHSTQKKKIKRSQNSEKFENAGNLTVFFRGCHMIPLNARDAT